MAIKADTWRDHSMRVGAIYMAVRTFDGALGACFHEGRRYTLTAIAHSHHDEATVLTFEDEGSRVRGVWTWLDSEPLSAVEAHFRAAGA